jgi:hypothetical protein
MIYARYPQEPLTAFRVESLRVGSARPNPGISAAPQEDIMTPFTAAELGRGAMAPRHRKQRLGAKARGALELLAAASPSCPELLLLAHGFKIEMLAGLVREGLATAQPEAVNAGGQSIEVARMKITDAGRRAIAA